MKYMMLIYSPENAWTQEEWDECVATSMGVCKQLAANGELMSAAPLHGVATAKCVRVRQGNVLVTDGPFAETTEQLGGYYVIDVPNLDEAIAIASRLPPVHKGTVEIRPIRVISGLPADKWGMEQSASGEPLKMFMFLCYDDEVYWTNAGEAAHLAAIEEAVLITQELDGLGRYVSASPLHSVSTATSVRVRNGQRFITDGPFAETREILGGYYVILAPNQHDAVAIAARHSGARVGTVEVRQVHELPQIESS